jgi:hypothetical protein
MCHRHSITERAGNGCNGVLLAIVIGACAWRCLVRSGAGCFICARWIYSERFLLRFGNKVVLCDKKMVRVHEWKLLADRDAAAAYNVIEIGEFARAFANCRNCTNKVFIFGRASPQLCFDSCHSSMKVFALAGNFLSLRQASSSFSS